MIIELITDPDCPNVPAARELLADVLAELHLPLEWTEWDRNDPSAPDYVHRYGSPTILVNGRDVAGDNTQCGHNCCRVYAGTDGFRGVPDPEQLRRALTES